MIILLFGGYYRTDTTDVQTVEVIYFRNRLFLRCSFADNSRARGCAIRLSLADGSDDETYQWLRDGDDLPCFQTNFRLDADVYSETVAVVDIEEDGMLGSGNLTVIPVNETIEEMFSDITGCPIGNYGTIIIMCTCSNEIGLCRYSAKYGKGCGPPPL